MTHQKKLYVTLESLLEKVRSHFSRIIVAHALCVDLLKSTVAYFVEEVKRLELKQDALFKNLSDNRCICRVNIGRGNCMVFMETNLGPRSADLIERGRVATIRELNSDRPPAEGQSMVDIPGAENNLLHKTTTACLVAWDKVCKPYKEGGINLRRLKTINQSLMMKLSWNFLNPTDGWSEFMRAKFISKSGNFSRITKGSSIWAGVRGAIEDVRAHSGWVIGDGASIDLWQDNWCSLLSLKDWINDDHIP
ncbi:hypothetical protein GIB67_014795 [Kingdonia uniflora]|uniref:Uncharacterized protein n=1 Tax=Kingdonia uniflora TaxID=39325 RepID=A0A7J7NVP2_9MAGN|nr:hypothetical protein GIB67_014795 [Kingdonia uniflora]